MISKGTSSIDIICDGDRSCANSDIYFQGTGNLYGSGYLSITNSTIHIKSDQNVYFYFYGSYSGSNIIIEIESDGYATIYCHGPNSCTDTTRVKCIDSTCGYYFVCWSQMQRSQHCNYDKYYSILDMDTVMPNIDYIPMSNYSNSVEICDTSSYTCNDYGSSNNGML